jgi:hypothetical protein
MEKWYGRRAENRKLKMGVEKSGPSRLRAASREKRDSSQKTRWKTLPHFADSVRNDGLSFSREFETRRRVGKDGLLRAEAPFVRLVEREKGFFATETPLGMMVRFEAGY